MKSYLLVALVTILISCQPPVSGSEVDCETTFIRTEQTGCYLPVVLIDKGLEQVRQLAKTSSTYEGYFSVCRLDSTYRRTNTQLVLRVCYPSQPIVCDAYGLSHPAIEVVSVH